jgi:pectate disaccharide-lyase
LSVTSDAIDFGIVFAGETSISYSIGIQSLYLSSDIQISVNGTGFEVSTDNLRFDTIATLSKSAASQPLFYVRYASPAIPTGSLTGKITLRSDGASPIDIVLTAFSSEAVPTVMPSLKSVHFGYVLYSETSIPKHLSVVAKYLVPETGRITVYAPNNFQVSLYPDSGFVSSLELPYLQSKQDTQSLYLRFVPVGSVHKALFQGNLRIEGGGASAVVALSGMGITGMEGISRHFYISPDGNDITGDGSMAKPWYNVSKAVAMAVAGDTIHCRGGKYNYNETIRLTSSGLPSKRICIFAFQRDDGTYEQPVFDFGTQPYGASNRAFLITGNYWYLFGIHITHAGDNGIKLEGNYCIVERCVFSYNGDSGIQLGFGHTFSDTHPGISKNDGSYCAYNIVVDCDSYQNYDPDNYGSDADGFACKMHNGRENWFLRCRAWNNSDDAWDLYETDFPVYIIECWGWHSGDASQHSVSGGSFQGNGNGLKLGGNGTGGSSVGKHEVWNCIAFNNNKTNSVKGFDQNSHKGGVKLVNCLAYNNGYDFMFEDSPGSTTNDFYNNVCLSNRIEINATGAVMQNNVAINNPSKGWLNAVNVAFSAADYTDLSESAAKQPRSAEGALPDNFARLKPTSKLVDMGVSALKCPLPSFLDQPLVGSAMSLLQPEKGNARDLGPYESDFANSVSSHRCEVDKLVSIPSPSGCLQVKYKLTVDAPNGRLAIYTSKGQLVRNQPIGLLRSGVEYSMVESGLNAGIYMVVLQVNGMNRILKAEVY